MPLEEKIAEDPFFGLLFYDQILFSQFFWDKDLSLPMSVPQKVMYGDVSERRLNCTGRKTGKTVLIEGTIIRLGCIHEGDPVSPDEAMFFAPGQTHMAPVRDRVVSKLVGHSIFKHFLAKFNKNEGVLEFSTGLKWIVAIEGTSGQENNMVGFRTIYMLGDELAFGNHACERGRKQTALPGCKWMYCGVPNGVRDTPFYELDQTHLGNSWSRHKLNSFDNPGTIAYYGGVEATMDAIATEYGGVNTQGFVTQALGLWGEEAYSAFPPEAVAQRLGLPYTYLEFRGSYIKNLIDSNLLASQIRLPRVNAQRYVIGLDYGYAQDPAVIMIFYELERGDWQQLARIKLWRVPTPHQAKIIDVINRELLERRVAVICTDRPDVMASLTNTDEKTSLGNLDNYADKCILSDPTGTAILKDEMGKEMQKDGKPIKMRRKEWMTEILRKAMAYANAKLPNPYYIHLCSEDAETLEELVGTVQRGTAAGYMLYDPAKKGEDHNTDALRDVACAIDFVTNREDSAEWEDDLEGLGWAQVEGVRWQPPWVNPTPGSPLR